MNKGARSPMSPPRSGYAAVSVANGAVALSLLCAMIIGGVAPMIAAKLSIALFLLVFPLGFAVARWLFPKQRDLLALTGMGIGFGVVLFPVTAVPFFVAGWMVLHPFAMIATTMLVAVLLARGPALRLSATNWVALPLVLAAFAVVAALCFICTAGIGGAPYHMNLQAMVVSALSFGYPIENPFVAGIPYRYNFGAHLGLLAVARITGIAIDDLAGHAAQIAYLAMTMVVVYGAGRQLLALRGLFSLLPVIATYFVFGWAPLNYGLFMSAVPTSSLLTLSPLLGQVAFVVSVAAYGVLAPDSQRSLRVPSLMCLVALGFAASMERANAGVVLALAASLFWTTFTLRNRSINFGLTACTMALGLGCVAGIAFTLGLPGATRFSGTGFIALSPTGALQYIADRKVWFFGAQLRAWGVPDLWSAVATFGVGVLLHASFLSPFFWFRLFRRRLQVGNVERLLLMSVLVGFAVAIVTNAPGGSHFIFLQMSKLAMALIGAREAQSLWCHWRATSARTGQMPRLAGAVSGLGIVLAVMHGIDGAYQISVLRPQDKMFQVPATGTRLTGSNGIDIGWVKEQFPDANTARVLVAGVGELGQDQQHQWASSSGVRLLSEKRALDIYGTYGGQLMSPMAILRNRNDIFLAEAGAGHLDLGCAVAVADASLGDKRDIYLVASPKLSVLDNPRAIKIGQTDRLAAWRILPKTADSPTEVCPGE